MPHPPIERKLSRLFDHIDSNRNGYLEPEDHTITRHPTDQNQQARYRTGGGKPGPRLGCGGLRGPHQQARSHH